MLGGQQSPLGLRTCGDLEGTWGNRGWGEGLWSAGGEWRKGERMEESEKEKERMKKENEKKKKEKEKEKEGEKRKTEV